MLQLPNNCRAGKFTYSPKNWDKPGANPKLKWKVYYWFYDDNLGKRKKIVLKDNRFDTAADKKAALKNMVEVEIDLLLNKEVNHITGKQTVDNLIADHSQLSPGTPFNIALDLAFKNFGGEKTTRLDIKSCLKYFKQASATTTVDGYFVSEIPISQIGRNHMYHVLNKCGELKGDKWSNNNYNHYRKYIQALIEEMVNPCQLNYNAMKSIKRKKIIKKLRETLCREERVKIDTFLKEKHYNYWRLMHMFFHSGARESEFFKIRKCDVDLQGQRYKSVILKGRAGAEKWRPIKDIVLHFWKELFYKAAKDQYLFSKGMQPGDISINPRQITRWWARHIKTKLNIKANFYDLKHANTTEVMDHLTGIQEAAKKAAEMNGHTTETMVVQIYDTKHSARVHSAVKKVSNPFV